MVAPYDIPTAPRSDDEWLAVLLEWALAADQQGRHELSSALRQIIQVWLQHLPAEVVQRMINTGHLLIDTVQAANRMAGRRRSER